MSFSQNALNSEKIKTQQDIIDVRNSYKAQLQSQININKINRNVNALYEFNGSLPHYTPSLRTTQEILADKNELKKNTIEYIQDALLADAQNAIGEHQYFVSLYQKEFNKHLVSSDRSFCDKIKKRIK